MILVWTTFPDAQVAREVAGRLLDEKLAACVSLLPASESIYDWQGERLVVVEVPVMIKTTDDAYPRLEAALREWHPYEVPEIIAVPVVRCLEAYGGWVCSSCGS